MPQLNYGVGTPVAVAGQLADISPYKINSRFNGFADGALRPGMGADISVLVGDTVTTPANLGSFEGIVLNSGLLVMDGAGLITFNNGDTLNLLQWGVTWGIVAEGKTINYGDPLYMIEVPALGANLLQGFFSNTATEGANNNRLLAGRFVSNIVVAAGDNDIAMIELFHE